MKVETPDGLIDIDRIEGIYPAESLFKGYDYYIILKSGRRLEIYQSTYEIIKPLFMARED